MSGKYVDSPSFVGQKVPSEVKLLIKELKSTTQPVYRKILQQTVNYIKSSKTPNFSVKGGPLEPNNAQILFAGFYCLLTRALRQGDHMPKAAFERDLQELNISKEVISDLCMLVYSDTLHQSPTASTLPHITDVDWRVDVTLSNNSLAKVLQPEVLLNLTLSDTTTINTQLSLDQFHLLRRSAATLHDMCQLNERQFMIKK